MFGKFKFETFDIIEFSVDLDRIISYSAKWIVDGTLKRAAGIYFFYYIK